ncbi:MAG: LysR family transcriptional regulator [Bilifractor sp.]|jgi:DNA-binding transcriptional LysR family regulator
MTLLGYQVFKTVTEAGSFHKAADILGLTPSAISHAVASMEKELGFSVFTRNKSGVMLTNYGEHLLPYVNAVLNSDESLRQSVAELKGMRQGKIKVGCFSSVCTNWMPRIIKSFGEMYPAIGIEVYEGTYDDVYGWVKSGAVDLGFLSTSSSGELKIEPFYRDPLKCIVPLNFEKADPSSEYISIEEMSRHQFVVQRESTDADIQNYLRENNLKVQTNYHVVDDLSTIAIVASGFGICIMPELVMNDIPYEVRQYRMLPDASRLIGIATLNQKVMAPAVKMLYGHILREFGNLEET